jgi:hypothetical protein
MKAYSYLKTLKKPFTSSNKPSSKINKTKTTDNKQIKVNQHVRPLSLRDSLLGKKTVSSLPDDFFEKVLQCEIKLKKGFNINTLQELITYYSTAIEYYESINDPRYKHYSQSLNILLTQPEILKQMNMQTKEGKINFKKEQKKKTLKDQLKKVDLSQDNPELANEILQAAEQDKKGETLINQDLSIQQDNFLKRKNAKKQKYLLSTSDVTDAIETMKNKRRINLKKQINKSFDINQKEKDNISFGNDKGEELNNLTLQDEEQKRNTNVMETVNKDIDVFLNEFSEIFNEKITSNLLDELKDILSDKNKELTTLSRSYSITP